MVSGAQGYGSSGRTFCEGCEKEGGAYVKDTGILKKIDEHTHTLVLVCEQEEVQIDIWKIIEILI